MKIRAFFQKIRSLLDDVLLPDKDYCHCCERVLYYEGCFLCDDCLLQLEQQRLPRSDAVAYSEPLQACVSAFSYTEPARSLVLKLKFSHDLSIAPLLYYAMTNALQQRQWDTMIDVIIPVPLHERRFLERGYNQSMVLAKPIGELLQIPVTESALYRTRNTGAQMKRSGSERRVALKSAFHANQSEVEGKNILLVDDVFTTGSTGVACAKALLEAGAKGVWMVTACRA